MSQEGVETPSGVSLHGQGALVFLGDFSMGGQIIDEISRDSAVGRPRSPTPLNEVSEGGLGRKLWSDGGWS